MRVISQIHRASTWLVLSVGLIHTLATFVFYDRLSEAATWFAGAGLSGIFVAFLNIALRQPAASPLSRKLASGANVLFLAWLVTGFAATPALPSGVVLAMGCAMALSGLFVAVSGSATGPRGRAA